MKLGRFSALAFVFVLAACASLRGEAPAETQTLDSTAAPQTSVTTNPEPTPFSPDVALRTLAESRGISLGVAVAANPLQNEPLYVEVLAREFNALTPENAMKMGPLRPSRERFDFSAADAIVDFAEAHNMQVRGHTLVWHQQLPTWLTEQEWTREELIEILREHILTVVGHYRGRVSSWDVVNEAVAGTCVLEETLWERGIGPEYIDMAFEWAHEADPDALLFYNDYGCEGLEPKADAVFDLAAGLLERGVPIHGVGLQMHLRASFPSRADDVLQNMERLAELGLEVNITEIDVAVRGKPNDTTLDIQADIYREMMEACLTADNCTSFVMWGFTDRHSWIPSHYPGWGAALILDEAYHPKPAYAALQKVLSLP